MGKYIGGSYKSSFSVCIFNIFCCFFVKKIDNSWNSFFNSTFTDTFWCDTYYARFIFKITQKIAIIGSDINDQIMFMKRKKIITFLC